MELETITQAKIPLETIYNLFTLPLTLCSTQLIIRNSSGNQDSLSGQPFFVLKHCNKPQQITVLYQLLLVFDHCRIYSSASFLAPQIETNQAGYLCQHRNLLLAAVLKWLLYSFICFACFILNSFPVSSVVLKCLVFLQTGT